MFKPSDLFIDEDSKAIEAIAVINKTLAFLALVVDKNCKLIGTITDGDIRRGLLNRKTLESSTKEFMNKNFLSIKENELSESKVKRLFKIGINLIPVLDTEGHVIELLNEEDLSLKFKSSFNTVVIMAGGKGQRLRPFTSNCPKPMIPINGQPMLEIIIEKCIRSGFQNFYISVNYLKEQIINYFGNGEKWGIKINYIYEDFPLGTAGSLKLLPENISESILVLNGDIITNLDLSLFTRFHQKHNASMTIAAKNEQFKIPYGVITNSGIELENIIEKPTYNFLVAAGIYIIKTSILRYIEKNKFFDMPDLVYKLKEKSLKVVTFPIHEYWIDVGKPETLDKLKDDWPLNN